MPLLNTGDYCFMGMPIMMDVGVFPTESNVVSGNVYGENNQLSGTFTTPSPDDVRFGVGNGNLVIPSITNVKSPVQYGTSGTEFTGTLQGLFPVNPGGPIVGDKLTIIQNGIIAMIMNARNLDGYNYDYLSTQQEDFNKVVGFPHINVYLMPNEDNLDEPEHTSMNAFRNTANFELHCYQKLSAEDSNAVFSNNLILNNMLHDVKKMIGEYPTGEGLWEYIMYDGSERVKSGIGDDIFIPQFLKVNIKINYTQDVTEPNNNGYC